MNLNIRNKVASIAGGGKGIGRTIGLTLAKEGAHVIFVDCNNARLDTLSNDLRISGILGDVFHADVTKKAEINGAINYTISKYDGVHILVNNAGVAPSAYVDEMSEEIWDSNMDINLKGTFLASQAVIPIMKRQRWGRIINASSFAAMIPSAGFSAYAAAKAGIVAFTKVLAAELGPWN